MEEINHEPTPKEELAFLFPREYWEEGEAPPNAVSIFDVPDPLNVIDGNYWQSLQHAVSLDRSVVREIAAIREAIDNGLQLTQEQADRILSVELKRLEGADFSRLNLRGADLSFARLQGAKFFYTDLTDAFLRAADNTGANFQYAKNHRAYFEFARNENADFSYAENIEAHFFGACNRGAKFLVADLTDADFRNADNRGADFGCAMITRTDFNGANNEGANFIFANKMD